MTAMSVSCHPNVGKSSDFILLFRQFFNIFLISSTQFIAYQGVGIKRKCLPLRPTVRVRIQN